MATVEYSEANNAARFMGLPDWKKINDFRLVEKVEAGLPVSTADRILQRIDPKGTHFNVHDIIPKASYYRRKEKGVLTKEQSEKVHALSKVFAEALRQYHDDVALVSIFLNREHPMLGNRTPFDVATESTAGADLVLNLLRRAEAGVAV